MKIKEFVQDRNVSYNTVVMYINRHKKMFKGHIGKSGNIILDDVAVDLLEKQYPLEKPVELICDDTAARKQLIEAQQKIIELQEHINMMLPVVQEYKHQQYLLEQAEKRADQAIKEKESNEKARSFLYKKVSEQFMEADLLIHENERLYKENEMLKKRTFFERVFNKEKEVEERTGKYDKIKNQNKINMLDEEVDKILKQKA